MAKKRGIWGRDLFFRIRYRIGEWCVRGFVAIFPWLPSRFFTLFTDFGARLTFLLLWKYRRRMEQNLSSVMAEEFPTAEARKALARKAWNNFARMVYETICMLFFSKEEIRSRVKIHGESSLKRALEKRKGVVALSAHLGNFTMIGARLAASGYPFSVVVKQPGDPRFARLIDEYRSVKGMKTISARPRREAARQVIKALRKNEVVLLIADEFKSGGVEVEFLGRIVPAPRGPVTLAMRTGAALVPMFVTRDHDEQLTLHIGSEIGLARTADLQQDVAANVGLFVRQLEEMVRRYPDQWNWLGFRQDGRMPRRKVATPKADLTDEPGDSPSLP